MRTRIVRIGNSQGVRIPKALLEESGLSGEVDISVHEGALVIARFDVFLVNLDPAVGSEIRKARPCVVVSPDEMNRHVRTVVVPRSPH